MTPDPTDESCARCGGTFDLQLCVVWDGPGHPDRDRLEGYLCYDCRRSTPNKPLNSRPDGGETA